MQKNTFLCNPLANSFLCQLHAIIRQLPYKERKKDVLTFTLQLPFSYRFSYLPYDFIFSELQQALENQFFFKVTIQELRALETDDHYIVTTVSFLQKE